MKSKALEIGIFFHGGPTGEPRRELLYQGLMCRRWLWRWACLSIGALLGNLGGGGPFTGNFER
jgi:hypothetical protein